MEPGSDSGILRLTDDERSEQQKQKQRLNAEYEEVAQRTGRKAGLADVRHGCVEGFGGAV